MCFNMRSGMSILVLWLPHEIWILIDSWAIQHVPCYSWALHTTFHIVPNVSRLRFSTSPIPFACVFVIIRHLLKDMTMKKPKFLYFLAFFSNIVDGIDVSHTFLSTHYYDVCAHMCRSRVCFLFFLFFFSKIVLMALLFIISLVTFNSGGL